MSDGAHLLSSLSGEHRELLALAADVAVERSGRAYLVGGVVRDLLLGRQADDIDVVVVGDGMAVAQALARQLGGQLFRYHAFQTARVDLPDGQRLDVATARREDYPQLGQLPQVEVGTIEDDLARRDFTINALAVALDDPQAPIEDPFDGQGDIERGLVRILHGRSFADDPTRMLRALRFALRFGYRLEESTGRALQEAVRGEWIAELSPDRLRRELQKLLLECPEQGPSTLADQGLLGQVFEGLVAPEECLRRVRELLRELPEATVALQAEIGTDSWALTLAVMARDLAPQSRQELARRLRLSREQRRPLIDAGKPLIEALQRLDDSGSAGEMTEVLDAVGVGGLLVGAACEVASGPALEAVLAHLRAHRWVSPSLDGEALLTLGATPGPRLGELLRGLRRARIEGSVQDAAGERELAQKWLHSGEIDHSGTP